MVNLAAVVGRAVDLAHPARTNGSGDLVGTKSGAGFEGHDRPRVPENTPRTAPGPVLHVLLPYTLAAHL